MARAAGWSCAVLLVVALAALAGCSSTSSPDPMLVDNGLPVQIAEYVSDGHGGTKPPLFPLLAAPTQSDLITPQGNPAALNYGADYLYDKVYPGAINWFYLPALTVATSVIVTMQPVHDRDADLYVLSASDLAAGGGLTQVASSTRTPTAGGCIDAVAGAGYAPDWAFHLAGGPASQPALYVAAFGASGGAAGARYFRLEADFVGILVANEAMQEGSLGTGQSAWYWFYGYEGSGYRVGLAAVSGDPDCYVYHTDSSGFVAKNDAAGDGYAGFTAPAAGNYFVRVYGHSACAYRIRVLQP